MTFSNKLIQWYLYNKRDLPWRSTKNPYAIWLSEIILQQTRVDQGMAYYYKFLEHFPTVKDLALASEEQVLKLWQGLGYYSRARNLHVSAKYVYYTLNGVFPSTYNELIKLKGVGDYTASAIASICFNETTAVVDGNVYRVLARYFGIDTPINSTKGIKEFKSVAQELISVNDPGTHNQAVMEFGARLCKPQNPFCSSCPLNESCVAFEKKLIKNLPVKEKKIKIKKKYFNYIVIQTINNKTFLEKREEGIWLNMYQFPLIETSKIINEQQFIAHQKFSEIFTTTKVSVKLFNNEPIVHKLSHQHIYAKFWIVKTTSLKMAVLDWNEVEKLPVPKLIDNFLNQFNNN
ncbi:A/G-specific adenine glycosylase [uncultured Lutibacter sp.]|uniref:A/G-specific adenine glycosylase n=1 Tax=uncultured Lutibacter sp. TaxID=437739 RepID=UPI0026075CF1|nr:A/G-specific adenine glycosylase [uncultured Lutibacter sp.]